MATACFIMVITPEYNKIGITATIMIMVARMLQGFSSLGEIIGVQLYLSEMLKIPYRCVASGFMGVIARTGEFCALATASTIIALNGNWRWAFVFGMIVASIGLIARTTLREAPEFADYKKRITDKMQRNNQDSEKIAIYNEKINKKTILAFAFTEFHFPICFCVAYIYLGDFMKKHFNITAEQVISQNLKVSVFALISALITAYFVKKIHPIKIAIITSLFFSVVLPLTPY